MSHQAHLSESWTPEPWRPMRDYRMACTECDWRQIEQFKRNANRVARSHADESGHKVEMQRQQYKTIRPREGAERCLNHPRN